MPPKKPADRQVHARSGEMEIVRYNRAGKWYLEYKPVGLPPAPKLKITLAEAVSIARRESATVYLGKPGGRAFDRLIKTTTTYTPPEGQDERNATGYPLPCGCLLEYGPTATICDDPCHWVHRFMFTPSPLPESAVA